MPVPPQATHGWLNENIPWFSLTTPRPPHTVHTVGVVPGAEPEPPQVEQGASETTLTVVVAPRTASPNDRCSSASMSWPRWGPCTRLGHRSRARAPAPAENVAQEVAEVVHPEIRKARPGCPRGPGPGKGVAGKAVLAEGAYFVVLFALGLVADYVVSGRDLLEALFGAGMGIGVELLGQLAVGAQMSLSEAVLATPRTW